MRRLIYKFTREHAGGQWSVYCFKVRNWGWVKRPDFWIVELAKREDEALMECGYVIPLETFEMEKGDGALEPYCTIDFSVE